jgi:uncharacterized membrane protein
LVLRKSRLKTPTGFDFTGLHRSDAVFYALVVGYRRSNRYERIMVVRRADQMVLLSIEDRRTRVFWRWAG